MRERLGRGKRLEQAAAARDAVLEELLEQVEIPLPESIVADELNARRQNIEQQLAYAGITMEKYLEDEGQTQEEFEADLERRVRDAVAAQFILDEVAKKEEFGVDQTELSEHLVRRAQQSGQDPQEFANHMFEHNHIPELVQEILRGKALATIVESATVKDASGNVVELKNLRPDGTIGEPEAEARGRRGRPRRRRGADEEKADGPDPPLHADPSLLDGQRHPGADTRDWVHRRSPKSARVGHDRQPRPQPTGPRLLDALSLLSEVADELVVRTVRDTHVAWADRVHGLARAVGQARRPGAAHRGIAAAVYAGVGLGLRAASAGLDKVAGTGAGPRLEADARGRFVTRRSTA